MLKYFVKRNFWTEIKFEFAFLTDKKSRNFYYKFLQIFETCLKLGLDFKFACSYVFRIYFEFIFSRIKKTVITGKIEEGN